MQDSTRTRRYFGCQLRQRIAADTITFFVFYARAKDIRQWAGIRRAQEHTEGTQRVLRETRARAISRFIEASPINTIPNNILLAFEPNRAEFRPLNDLEHIAVQIDVSNGCGEQIEWGILEFSFEPDQLERLRPALIVDGQHRLYGLSEYDAENVPVLVVSLVDAPLQEQAFQFIVINNKAVKVPVDNAKAIIENINEDELRNRLLKAGVNYGNTSPVIREINDLPSSPFQNLLDWPYNRNGQRLVPLTAIEQSLRYLQAQFDFLRDDQDSLVEIFCAMWSAVKHHYPNVWGRSHDPDHGQPDTMMLKVNINAINEFLAERLVFAWEMNLVDLFNSHAVEQQAHNILGGIPEEFWSITWSIRVQDNANVRGLIKDDLVKILQNLKFREPWFRDLQLVKPDGGNSDE